MENGWNTLAITTNSGESDEFQAEVAGRIEAFLTIKQIEDHYENALQSNELLTEEIILQGTRAVCYRQT